jgi:hypothetical protein
MVSSSTVPAMTSTVAGAAAMAGLSSVEWACAGRAMNSASSAARVSDRLNMRYLSMIAPRGIVEDQIAIERN